MACQGNDEPAKELIRNVGNAWPLATAFCVWASDDAYEGGITMNTRNLTRALLLVALAALHLPSAGEGQIMKRVKDGAKRSLDTRKQRTEDDIVFKAGERVDSAIEFGARPMDSLIARAASGIDSVAVRTVRGMGGGSKVKGQLRKGLAEGRVELDVGFPFGSPDPAPEAERSLTALASVLSESAEPVLLEGRIVDGEPVALARLRAESIRSLLAEAGVESARVFVLGRPDIESAPLLGIQYLR